MTSRGIALKMVGETAPVDYAAFVEALTPETRQDVMRDLASIVQGVGTALGYMEGRYLYEHRPHEAGVKCANGLRTKIRKALGYAYPKQDFSF